MVNALMWVMFRKKDCGEEKEKEKTHFIPLSLGES